MRWPESDELAGERPTERAAIEKLDAFLAERRRDDVLIPVRVAAATGVPEQQVLALLTRYEGHRVLRGVDTVECPSCEQLSPVAEVEAAREEGVGYCCVRGDEDLASLEGLHHRRVFRLLSEPPPPIE